jgi:hypothetical protein
MDEIWWKSRRPQSRSGLKWLKNMAVSALKKAKGIHCRDFSFDLS